MHKTIFVTVGTTQFDLLCNTLVLPNTLETLRSLGFKRLIIQIGNSAQEPEVYTENGIEITKYRFKNNIIGDIQDADLVISHAGAGSCLEVLEAGKPLLVVVNEDLMDNHQLELATQFMEDGYLYYSTCQTLVKTLQTKDFQRMKPFGEPNTEKLAEYMDWFFNFN